jgi:hypothetical protein
MPIFLTVIMESSAVRINEELAEGSINVVDEVG